VHLDSTLGKGTTFCLYLPRFTPQGSQTSR